MSYLGLLNQSCTIRRRPEGDRTGYSGAVAEMVTVATGVKCSLRNSRGSQINNQAEFTIRVLLLFLPAGTDVIARDYVEIGSAVYDIKAVNTVWGAKAVHHIECQVEKID